MSAVLDERTRLGRAGRIVSDADRHDLGTAAEPGSDASRQRKGLTQWTSR